jgi:hypothetical protein
MNSPKLSITEIDFKVARLEVNNCIWETKNLKPAYLLPIQL